MFIYIWHQLSVLLLEGIATLIVVVICKGQQPLPIFWRSLSESALNAADSLDNSAPLAVLFAADVQQALQYRCFWLFNLLLAGPLLLHLRHALPALLARYPAAPTASSAPRPEPPTGTADDPAAAPAPGPDPSSSSAADSSSSTTTQDGPASSTSTSTSSTSTSSSSAAIPSQPGAPSSAWARAQDALRAAGSGAAAASTSAATAALQRLPPSVQGPLSALLRAAGGALGALLQFVLAAGGGGLRLAAKLLAAPAGSQPRPTTSLALTAACLATLAACLSTPFVEPLPDAQDPRGISGMIFSLTKIASLVLELSALRLATGLCWSVARGAATAGALLAASRKAAVLVLWRALVESVWAAGIGAQLLCGITSGWKLVASTCGAYLAWTVLRASSSPGGVQALLTSRHTLVALGVAALVTGYPVCLPPLEVLPELAIIMEGSSPIWTGIAA